MYYSDTPKRTETPLFSLFFVWVGNTAISTRNALKSKNRENNYAMVEINVDKFYSNRAYYPFIPGSIFQALENAYLSGKETAFVSEDEYNVMMSNINASLCPGQ